MPCNIPQPGETILLMDHLEETPVTGAEIEDWTKRDPVLSQAVRRRSKILAALHEAHPGVSRMKALTARSYVWWLGLDAEFEKEVKGRNKCQLHQAAFVSAPLHPREWPGQRRLHIDYAGSFHGEMVIVVLDAHSKYLEVHLMKSTTFGLPSRN
ncbi:Hypothetical predicted protein [Paramuricea clavata]|uniref:Integrase zinc-binding domain-containing protein n=1 Tax=Paramuricea clavata TaxID=317549 RepID=A0A7D9HB53_PARCT|nr:Hypothetical predicted protein [Paramuricea clavata]